MVKTRKTTYLKLYLSTGNLIKIFFQGHVSENVEEELQHPVSGNFFPYGWEVAQIVIENGRGQNLFYPSVGDPMCIDMSKIIGWEISEKER